MKARIHLVAGVRPNFMKIAPVYHALADRGEVQPIIVHTGQHSSAEMSDVFFRDLNLPPPNYHLNVMGETHAQQTAAVLIGYESLCRRERPDWTIVVGDVNSTLGACLAAKKLNIPVAHLEAGLRSGDRSMPEEINRLAVDAISDLLWTHSEDADANLVREGIPPSRIERVGNVMIDAYHSLFELIAKAGLPERLGLATGQYAVITLHRPVNVDDFAALSLAVAQLIQLTKVMPVVFPVHPRTKKQLVRHDLWQRLERAGLILLEPLSYIEFMSLVKSCAVVITDSGGVQEETSYLGIPCLTARDSTERPVTVSMGTNRLISLSSISKEAIAAQGRERHPCAIPLWDGKAASRIVKSLQFRLNNIPGSVQPKC